MFGFLRPPEVSSGYRSAYSRCCQHQRTHFGLGALPVLSYEAAFLYLFWLDATGAKTATLPQQNCCRLRRLPQVPGIDDAEAGAFCASFGLLLAGVKIDDDVRDGGGFRTTVASRMLRRARAKASRHLEAVDPNLQRDLDLTIASHLMLEHHGGHLPLETYVAPTAKGFGRAFGAMAALPGLQSRKDLLIAVGRHIGAAIIAFDCAADWERDQEDGSYNPLPDVDSRPAAMALARAHLAHAEAACRGAFGSECETVAVLAAVRRDLEQPVEAPLAANWWQRVALTAGAVASMAQTQSESKSNDGAACCALICCAMCALGAKGKLVGTSTETKDCCGNRRIEHRKAGPCDC
jgi:hypothetical protein